MTMRKSFALAAVLLLAACGSSEEKAAAPAGSTSTAAVVPAPNGGDWTQVVSETAAGGFVMGNPNAPVKLVEFASMTCSHCADFAANGAPKVIEEFVRKGQVSFEVRNFVRDPVDLGAALLARCGGPAPYFKLTEQIFAAQAEWFAKLQGMTPAEQAQLESMSPAQRVGVLSERAGLVQFVRVRGIPQEKAQSCLADQAALDRLVAMNEAATREFNVSGTPTFLINGRVAEGAAAWETLEPQLKAAVG